MRLGNWKERQIRKEVFELDTTGSVLGKVVITEGVDYGERVFVDSPPLSYFQDLKKAELNRQCEEAIVQGFTASNGHVYRTNRDDQTNMIGQKDELMSKTSITTVPWKTEDAGYIVHTREEWLTVYAEAFAHKKNQLFKYDTLKGEVYKCERKEEVDIIKW